MKKSRQKITTKIYDKVFPQLFLIIIAMIFVSCSNDDDYSLCCANQVHMDNIEIAINSENGTDLLNPTNPEAYRENGIKLYYKIDGEIVEVFDPAMDHPRNFLVYNNETENEYRIRIFLNFDRNEAQPITYIQWNETDRDTIKAEFYYSGPADSNYSFTIENLWFNGMEKEPYFEILK